MLKYFQRFALVILLSANYLWAQPSVSYSSLPVHHAPDKEFHMIHLDLKLHFNIQRKEIIGSATEKIVPLRTAYKTVHLNAEAMAIEKVIMGKKKLTFDYNGKILSIDLDRTYGLKDTLTFTVEYTAVPPGRGIFFIMPDSAYPDVTPQLWSQSESEDARFWYPCHDYPDDFGTSAITATVPFYWVVVSNGILKKVTADKKNRTKSFYWVENKPHVVYLNSIVAGKFKIIKTRWDDVPIYYYVAPQYVKDAEANFSHTPDIVKYLSRITGYHYPWQKLALSGVSEFTAGGMENVSAITLTDGTFHDKYSHPEETTTDLVSHETAHQWFGDLLTCRNWANIWLNEGFATYFEALYGEHAYGKDHFNYEMYKDHRVVLKDEKYENLPTVNNRYGTADDAFGANVYERGSSILHMLKNILGDKLFFKAIKYYVSKNQFQNVDTHDFEKAVLEATGRNLYWFYNEWLFKAGHPVFDVSYNYDSNRNKLYLNVEQTQKTDSLTPVYKMPVDVYIVTPSKKISERILIDSLRNSFVFDVQEKPLMVNFDEGNVLLEELNFDKSIDELAYQLKNDTNVVGRVRAAQQLGGKKGNEAEEALIAELRNDDFEGVRSVCAEALGNFKDSKAKNALMAAADDKDPDVKIAALNSMGNFQGQDVAQKIGSVFNNADIYQVKAAAVSALASAYPSKAIPLINKTLDSNSYSPIIRRAALKALLKLDSSKAYSEAEKFAVYGQPETLRIEAIGILTRLNLDKETTKNLLEKYSEDPYWVARLMAVKGLGRIGDSEVIPFLLKIEKKIDDYRILESIRISIKEIEFRSSNS